MKLTHTQHAVLTAAADHPAHRVEHFPENLKGAARTKVLASLLTRPDPREGQAHRAHQGGPRGDRPRTAGACGGGGRTAPHPGEHQAGGHDRACSIAPRARHSPS